MKRNLGSFCVFGTVLFASLLPSVQAQSVLKLSSSSDLSPCNVLTVTSRVANTGSVITDLHVTNVLPTTCYEYVAGNSVLTSSWGQVWTADDADPASITTNGNGSVNLAWDWSDKTAPGGVDHLLITELYNYPEGGDGTLDHDWVEIYNPTMASITMSGWKLKDALPGQENSLPDITLSAGEYVIIAADTNVFATQFTNCPSTVQRFQTATKRIGSGLNPVSDGVLLINNTATTIDAVSYGGSAAAFSPPVAAPTSNSQSLQRIPANEDHNKASDWEVKNPPTPGAGTLESGLLNGQWLRVDFQTYLSCCASNGYLESHIAYTQDGSAKTNSSVIAVGVDRPNLVVKITPRIQTAGYMDEVVWTQTVENAGYGDAVNARMENTLGSGLVYRGFDVAPTNGGAVGNLTKAAWDKSVLPALARLAPGDSVSVVITTRVESCVSLYMLGDTSWGCEKDGVLTVCEDTSGTTKTAGGSIAFEYRFAQVDGGIVPTNKVELNYCDGSDITFYMTNAADAGYALDIILRGVLPKGYSLESVDGSVIQNGTNVVVGTLPPGSSTNVTVKLKPGGSCPLNQSELLTTFLPLFSDSCGTIYEAPPKVLFTTLGSPAAASINYIAPGSISGGASSMTVRIEYAYTNMDNTSVTFKDTYQQDALWSLSAITGGGIDDGTNITWNPTLDGSGVYTAEYTYSWTDACGIAGFKRNTITADDFTDCQGCVQEVTGADLTYITDVTPSGCGTGSPSASISISMGDGPAESCAPFMLTNSIVFSAVRPATWDGYRFESDLAGGEGYLVDTSSMAAVATVLIDGVDVTGFVTLSNTTPNMIIDLSGLSGSAYPTPSNVMTALEVRWGVTVGSPGRFTDVSRIVTPVFSRSGFGSWNVGEANPELSITPLNVYDQCGVATEIVTLGNLVSPDLPAGTNALFPVYGATFEYNLDADGDGVANYTYVADSTVYSNMTALSGGSVTTNLVDNGTNLVWTLGNLAADGLGTIYFKLRAGCSVDTNEQHAADLRWNSLCNQGGEPNKAVYTPTNDLPDSLFVPSLYTYIQPVNSYLSSTAYAPYIYVFNSGAGIAHNLNVQMNLPGGMDYVGATVTGTVSAVTNVLWTFQSDTPYGSLIDADGDGFYDDLPPNGSVVIYVTNRVTACGDDTIRAQTWSGCGPICGVSDTASASYDFEASHFFASAVTSVGDLCGTSTVQVAVKNAGITDITDMELREILPVGFSYVADSTAYSVDGGTSFMAAGNPSGAGTSGDPYVWSYAQIASFAYMEGAEEVLMRFVVEAECDVVEGDYRLETGGVYNDLCSEQHGIPSTYALIHVQLPELVVTNEARNVTAGGTFTESTTVGDQGETMAYKLSIAHAASSPIAAKSMKLTDVLPVGVTYVGASVAPDSTAGGTLIWSNTTLMALVGGDDFGTNETLSILVTGQVATCTASTDNSVRLAYGCADDCQSLSNSVDTAHYFAPQFNIGTAPDDGLVLTSCGGTYTTTVTNYGASATGLILTNAAPDGYVCVSADASGQFYGTNLTLALSGTPNGKFATLNLSSTASSGAKDKDDGDSSELILGNGEYVKIVYHLASDGSTLDDVANPTLPAYDDPGKQSIREVEVHSGVSYTNMCAETASRAVSKTDYPDAPNLDIGLFPENLTVTNAQVSTFTVRVKNDAEQGNASDAYVRMQFGSGWTNVAMVSTTLQVTAGSAGDITSEVYSNYVLINMPLLELNPLSDFVEFEVLATAQENSGSLDVLAEVVGRCTEAGIVGYVPTNIWGQAPLANTVTGAVIGAVNGNYYSFDQDMTPVAGFTLRQTIRLNGEAVGSAGAARDARIGEDLVLRVEAFFFGNIFSNAVITNVFSSGFDYGTPSDAGSYGDVTNNNWNWDAGGWFTMPTTISTDSVFLVDIPVIVSNLVANQGTLGNESVLTNGVQAAYDVLFTNQLSSTESVTAILQEPNLCMTQTFAASTYPVQDADVVWFTNHISQTALGVTNAYDLIFTDTLPASLVPIDPGSDGIDNDGDGNTDDANEATMLGGQTVRITATNSAMLVNFGTSSNVTLIYKATVANALVGSVLTNDALLTYTSMPGDNDNERDGSQGPSGVLNDYACQTNVDIAVQGVTLSKELTFTSQQNTTASNVVVGERMVYKMRVEVPNGISTNAVLVDLVPPGLDWVGSNPAAELSYPGLGYAFDIPAGGPIFATNVAQGLVITDPDPTPSSSLTLDGSGSNITFNIGTITNVADADSGNNYFDLYMEFVLLNAPTNTGWTTSPSSNRNAYTYTDAYNDVGATSDWYNVVDCRPLISAHSVLPTTGADAGNLMTFSVTVTNQSTAKANAYDLEVQNILSNHIYQVDQILMTTTPAGWTVSSNVAGSATTLRFTSDAGTALAPTSSVVFTFTVPLAQTVAPNLRVTNKVSLITSDALSNAPPSDIAQRNYTSSRTAAFTLPNMTLVNSLYAKSETDLGDATGSNVQIGEIVTYEHTLTLPESTISNLVITNFLPAGLAYVTNSAVLDVTGLDGTPGTLTVGGAAGSGDDITLLLAGNTVVNAGSAGHVIKIRVDAVVLNIPANTNGLVLTSVGKATFAGNRLAPVDGGNVAITNVIPSLALTSTMTTTNPVVDAGTRIDFSVTLTNSGSASAYNLAISNLLDTTVFDMSSVLFHAPTGFAMSVTNGTLYFASTNTTLAPTNVLETAQSLTFNYEALLSTNVTPGFSITNIPVLYYSDTLYATNDLGEQRVLPRLSGTNVLQTDGFRSIALDVIATSETGLGDQTNNNVQVGEEVTYQVRLTLPQGSISNLVVTNFIPAGMAVVCDSAGMDSTTEFTGFVPTLTASAGSCVGGLANEGAALELALNGMTHVTGATNHNTLIFTFTGVVMNVSGNTNNRPLAAHAEATFDQDPIGPLVSNSETITNKLPTLALTSTMTTTNPVLDAGTRIDFSVTLTNSGTASAYNLSISNLLDTTVFDMSSVLFHAPTGFAMSVTNGTLYFASTNTTLAPTNLLETAQSLTFNYEALLSTNVTPGFSITNIPVLYYSDTLYATNEFAQQRALPVLSGTNVLKTAGLTSIALDVIATSETRPGDQTGNNVQVGEEVTYEVRLTLPEGSISNLVVTNFMPAGVAVVCGSAAMDSSTAFDGTVPSLTASALGCGSGLANNGADLELALNGMTYVTADGNTNNNTLIFTFTGVVMNVDGNINNKDLTAKSEATFAADPDGPISSGNETVTVKLPDLAISKAITQPFGTNSMTVDVQLTLTNNGSASAYNLTMTDVLNTNVFDVTSIGAIVVPTGFVFQTSANTITVASVSGEMAPTNTLRAATGLEVSFQIDLQADLPMGTETNQVVLTAADTLFMTNGFAEQRSLPVITNADTMITYGEVALNLTLDHTSETGPADSTGSEVQIGEIATYDLAITLPEGTMPVFSITNVLPDGLKYVPNSSVIVPDQFSGQTGSVSVVSSGGSGADLVWSLSGVTVPMDSTATQRVLHIQFDAVVMNQSSNTNGVILTNAATLTYPNNPYDPFESGNVTVDVVTPDVSVSKWFDKASVIPGGTVQVTLRLTNSGSASAYNLLMTDAVDTVIFDAGSISGLTAPTGFVISNQAETVYVRSDSTLSSPTNVLITNASIDCSFTVDVLSSYAGDATITNTVAVPYMDTLYSANSQTEQRNIGPLSAEAPIYITAPTAVGKSVTGSSEAASSNGLVQVGETISYSITVDVPEVALTNLVITDQLPAGMSFVRGSVQMNTNDFLGTLGTLTVAPTGTGLAPDGDDVAITLSTVQAQLDSNAANNRLVFALDAVVLNTNSNSEGTGLTNGVSVTFTDNPNPATESTPTNVTVALPDLAISKSIAPTNAIENGAVTITLLLTNSGTASAYNILMTDVLATNTYQSGSVSNIVVPDGFAVAQAANTVSVYSVTNDVYPTNTLPAGSAMQVQFEVRVLDELPMAVRTNAVVLNAADTLYATNDYAQQRPLPGLTNEAVLNVSGSIELDLSLHATSEIGPSDSTGHHVQIGEVATYDLAITLPMGAIPSLAITNFLPDGLAYVPGSVVIMPDGFSGSTGSVTAVSGGGSGTNLVLDLSGTTVNVDAGTNNILHIYFDAVVVNQPSNDAGTVLTNSAALTYDGNLYPPSASGNETVDVIVPVVSVSKAFAQDYILPGQRIALELTLTNSGSATAYNLELTDLLDPTLYDPSTVVTGVVPDGFTLIASNNSVYVRSLSTSGEPTNTLEAAEGLSFGFSVNMADGVTVRQEVTNQVTVTAADTLYATNGMGEPRDVSGDMAEDTVSITVPLTVDKILLATSETGIGDSTNGFVQVGEVVTYRMVVRMPEMVVSNFTLVDSIPDGLAYVKDSAVVLTNVFNGTIGPLVVDPAGSGLATNGQDVSMSIDAVTPVIDGLRNNNTFYIDLNAVVANDSVNTNGALLVNAVAANFDGKPGDPATATNDMVSVVEPVLSLSSSMVSTGTLQGGATVDFTVTLTNTGTASAYNLVITNAFDPNLFVMGSLALSGPDGYQLTSTGSTIYISSLPGMQSPTNVLLPESGMTFSYQATLSSNLPPSFTLTNVPVLAYADSLYATNIYGNERVSPTLSATNELTSAGLQELSIEVLSTGEIHPGDLTGTNVQVGEVVTYQITLTLPEGTVPDLSLTNLLPAGMSYVCGSAALITTQFVGTVPALLADAAGCGTGEISDPGASVNLGLPGNTVVTPNGNTNDNTLIFTIQTVVLNVTSNTNETPLAVSTEATFGGNPNPATDGGQAGVLVKLPELALSKTIAPSSIIENGQVTITLQLTNSGAASAYNIRLSDVLETNTYQVGSVSNAVVPAGFGLAVSANTVSVYSVTNDIAPTNTLPTGQVLTVSFDARVLDELPMSEVRTNAVVLNAADTLYATNDYAQQRPLPGLTNEAVLNVSGSIELDLSLHATSEKGPSDSTGHHVQIGEVATYDLAITLPVGAIPTLTITNFLPAGLAYVPGSVVIMPDGFSGTTGSVTAVSGGGSGTNLVLDLSGTTVNADAGTNNILHIYFDAVVVDQPSNADGTVLTNSASLTYVGNLYPPSESGTETVDVIVPVVNISKSFERSYILPDHRIGVVLELNNSGSATAYNLELTDALDSSLYQPDTVQTNDVPAGFELVASNQAVYVRSLSASGEPTNTLEVGESLQFGFSVMMAKGLVYEQVVTNQAVVSAADTLYATNPMVQQRDVSGAVDADTVTVSVALELDKTLHATSETRPGDSTNGLAQVGEILTYRLAFLVPELTVSNLLAHDLIPDGMAYVQGSAHVVSNGFNGTIGTLHVTPTGTGLATNGQPVTLTIDRVAPVEDASESNNWFYIDFEAVVMNLPVNTNGNPLLNVVDGTFDGNPAPVTVTNTEVTVAKPELEMYKEFVPAFGYAGDRVQIHLLLTNSGSASAYNVVLSDPLGGLGFECGSASNVLVPDGWEIIPTNGVVTVQAKAGTMPATNVIMAGQALDVRFSVKMATNFNMSAVITNVAEMTSGSSLYSTNRYGQEEDLSGIKATNYFSGSNTLSMAFSLYDTSEKRPGDLTGTNVQVGEVVTYAVAVTLPKGQVSTLMVTNFLPAGMSYVLGSARLDLTDYEGTTGVLEAVPTGSGLADDGQDVTIRLEGNTITSGGDGHNVLRFLIDAVVRDDGTTGSGTTLDATAALSYNGNPNPPYEDGPVTLQVQVPELAIAKSITPNSALEGQLVSIALALTNRGTASAYNVRMVDVLEPVVYDVSTLTNMMVTTGFVASVSGNTVNVYAVTNDIAPTNTLPTGGVVQVQFDVKLQSELPMSLTDTNAVVMTYADSLYATNAYAQQRVLPVITNEATLSVTGSIAVALSLHATSETGPSDSTGHHVQVGEIATYDLAITLPPGAIPTLSITNYLPPGLAFVPGSAVIMPDGFNGTTGSVSVVSGGGSGTNLVLNLAGTVVADDDTRTNNTLHIYFDAVVADVGSNLSGTILTNASTVTYANNPYAPSVSDDVTVDVILPVVDVAKTVDLAMVVPGSPIEVGLTLTNSGNATAYNLELTDALDASIYDFSSLVKGSAPAGFELVASNNTLYVRSLTTSSEPDNTLEANEGLTFSFKVNVKSSVADDRRLTNVVAVTGANTLYGTNVMTQQRDVIGATGQDVFMVRRPLELDKKLIATSETGPGDSTNGFVQIGEVLTYRLPVTVPETVLANLFVNDYIPSGLAYVLGSARVVTNGFAGTIGELTTVPAGTGLAADGQDVIMRIDQVSPTLNQSLPDNMFYLELQAVVLNDAANTSGRILENHGDATYDNNPYTNAVTTNVSVTVQVPDVAISKQFEPAFGYAGDRITIHIALTNSGTASAYNLEIQDPIGMKNVVTGSLLRVQVPDGWAVMPTAGVVTVRSKIDTLPPTNVLQAGEALDVIFSVQVTTNFDMSGVLTNVAELTSGSSLYSNNIYGQEKDLSGIKATNYFSGSNTLSMVLSLFDTSESRVGDSTSNRVQIGETVTYEVAVTLPKGQVSDLTTYVQLPDGVSYVLGSARLNVDDFEGSAGSMLTVPQGSGSLAPDGEDVQMQLLGITQTSGGESNNVLRFFVDAVVLDDAAHVAGTTMETFASVTYPGHAAPVKDGPVTVDIVEPALALQKTIVPNTGDALDTVRVSFLLTNSGSASAYNLSLEDTLDTNIFDVTTVSNAVVPEGFMLTQTGPKLTVASLSTFTSNMVQTASVFEVAFDVNLVQDVTPNYRFTNVVTLAPCSSIQTTGVGSVERTYSSLAATATVSVADISLLLDVQYNGAPAVNVPVGEVVNVSLWVTLPESTIPELSVTEWIPSGLSYILGTATVDDSMLNGTLGTLSINPSGSGFAPDGQDVVCSFAGDSVVTADNVATNDRFLIEFNALVLDTPSNINGTVLTNVASATFTNNPASPAGSNEELVTVVRPSVAPPVVHFPWFTNVTTTTAELGAILTSTGSAPVTVQGIIWSTNAADVSAQSTNVYQAGVFGTNSYSPSESGLPIATNLEPGTWYYFVGFATNSVGQTTSETNQFLTLPVVTATPATGVDLYEFTANWNPSQSATNYYLTVSNSTGVIPGYDGIMTGTNLSMVVTGLTPGVTYYYSLVPENPTGKGPISNVEQVMTTGAILDWTPTNLFYFAVQNGILPQPQTYVVTNLGVTTGDYTNQLYYGDGASNWFAGTTIGSLDPQHSQIYTSSVNTTALPVGTYYVTNILYSTNSGGVPLYQVTQYTITDPLIDAGTNVRFRIIEWLFDSSLGIFQAQMEMCNIDTSPIDMEPPYHYAMMATDTYKLWYGVGKDQDGRDYVDVTDQIIRQVPSHIMYPGDCIMLTNLWYYSRDLQLPDPRDEVLWAVGSTNSYTPPTNIAPVVTAPIAHDRTFAVTQNVGRIGWVTGYNAEGSVIKFYIAQQPQHGSVELAANGWFKYTPTTNYVGDDYFLFRAQTIPSLTDTGRVSIVVSGPVNNAKSLPWLLLLLGQEVQP